MLRSPLAALVALLVMPALAFGADFVTSLPGVTLEVFEPDGDRART